MCPFVRTKRVSDPLDDKTKAMIVSGDSSGSEHGESPSLSDLAFSLLFGGVGSPKNESDLESESDTAEEIVYPMVTMRNDPFRNSLMSYVFKAMEIFSRVKSNKSVLRRSVMGYLREIGYDAAICKTRWESSGGLTAGSHEFLDVVINSQSSNSITSRTHRYFIEIDFLSEFEIARATDHYKMAFNTLPRIFIGTKEELKQIVKSMCDSAKRSLKSRGLSLPPWRKNRFMQNKWFSSYKRTTNLVLLNKPLFPTPAMGGFAVKCRYVGFDAVNGGLGFNVTTRTR